MQSLTRTARVESIDEATGEFSMVLATEGEASDGHILSIAGGSIPERMPLLDSHNDRSTEGSLGSVLRPTKDFSVSPHQLRAVAKIETDGDGERLAVRRDLAHMMREGHIDSFSIKWDAVRGTPRVDLPADHPHHVSRAERGVKRDGIFFEEWGGAEGSVVLRGSDQAAKATARANETEGAVSQFWRSIPDEAAPENAGAHVNVPVGEITTDDYTVTFQNPGDDAMTREDVREIVADELQQFFDLLNDRLPEADQRPDEARADQPDNNGDADQQPNQPRGLTFADLTSSLRKSRQQVTEETGPAVQAAIDKARGRVSNGTARNRYTGRHTADPGIASGRAGH